MLTMLLTMMTDLSPNLGKYEMLCGLGYIYEMGLDSELISKGLLAQVCIHSLTMFALCSAFLLTNPSKSFFATSMSTSIVSYVLLSGIL